METAHGTGRTHDAGSLYVRAAGWAGRTFGASPAFRRRENASASAEMKRAIAFSGLGVEPCEVAALSYAAAALTAAALLPLSIMLILLLGLEPFPSGFYLLLTSVLVPL